MMHNEVRNQMNNLIKSIAAEITRFKKNTVALTGSGISIASGIPSFRGTGGLWDKYDPQEYATIEAFIENPAKVWKMIVEFQAVIQKAQPNAAHLALAQLEKLGFLRAIITQNVDGLHQMAGNTNVIEFHGNNRNAVCLNCGKTYRSENILTKTLPPRCSCGGILKPDIIFFGESIPDEALSQSKKEVQQCGVVLVIGTSAVVEPAASLPYFASRIGATIIEINPVRALHMSIALEEKAEEIMPPLLKEVMRLSL